MTPENDGVKASLIPVEFPPCFYNEKNQLCGPHGAFLSRNPPNTGDSWVLCCPGCGEAGGPREGQHWQCTEGNFDDVTQLTLEPSILCGSCCGWHGYLRKGVFKSV